MARKLRVFTLLWTTWSVAGGVSSATAQVVAPSTWATGITIGVTLRDEGGTPLGVPDATEFNDWAGIPIALTDPEDNPDILNLVDIDEVQIANDASLLYIRVSGHRLRTQNLYLAFDTDQDAFTGFNVYGLDLVGSELGYVNDFVFDQRDPSIFNQNIDDKCCVGGPLDLNNGGALIYPAYDVEFAEREWAIPLDAMFSEVEPLEPTFPNATFNFIAWTDQGLTDVTETITYTLAIPPEAPGDFDIDGDSDGADFLIWQRDFPGSKTSADFAAWEDRFGTSSVGSAVPEPAAWALVIAAAAAAVVASREKARDFAKPGGR